MLLLHAHAPADAYGYRLFLPQRDGSVVGYPRDDGLPWLRWTGQATTARSFRLYPFEPPMVPAAGVYGVAFVARKRVEILPGEELLAGVYVEPSKVQGKP